jgi:exodeoxyribonuclease VII small subunit
MSDDRSTFETTRARLDDIVTQVRRKDVSLEQSLDMLEEAVRLVNQCNELIDQTSFKAPAPAGDEGAAAAPESPDVIEARVFEVAESVARDGDAAIEIVEIVELTDAVDTDTASAEPTPASDEDEWGSVDAWDEGSPETPSDEDDDARE